MPNGRRSPEGNRPTPDEKTADKGGSYKKVSPRAHERALRQSETRDAVVRKRSAHPVPEPKGEAEPTH